MILERIAATAAVPAITSTEQGFAGPKDLNNQKPVMLLYSENCMLRQKYEKRERDI